jgi:hypothetical protein
MSLQARRKAYGAILGPWKDLWPAKTTSGHVKSKALGNPAGMAALHENTQEGAIQSSREV